jgi:iron complex transport system substrate-binding protein
MRIVSLLPSATEIVFGLGLGEQLVGATHECDYPPEALAKPRVTSTGLPADALSSRAIDDGINQLLGEGSSIYHLDADLLERLQPDLILTQELCDVCAVAYTEVNRAAASVSSHPQVVNLEPNNLGQVLDTIRQVGDLTGLSDRAAEYVRALQARVDTVSSLTRLVANRPRVYCMEWLDPPMRAGHWVPELVELAGGHEGLGNHGEPSTKTSWQSIVEYQPEVIVLMPCGFDLPRTIAEAQLLSGNPAWAGLPAVRDAQVWAVDGSAYFSRPGPRLVDGLEILAHILCHWHGQLPTAAVARLV